MDDMRIGFGYDSHRFETGRRLVLGGVEISGEVGLRGHSEGGQYLFDFGARFPDTDARWRGADSAQLLARVVAEVASAGWTVGNVDVTVICEQPRIRPCAEAIRTRLAELLWPGEDAGQQVSRVSVKGKTNERMDDVGAGLGIEVHAACLLRGKAR